MQVDEFAVAPGAVAALDQRMIIVTDIERLMTSADMELIEEAAA